MDKNKFENWDGEDITIHIDTNLGLCEFKGNPMRIAQATASLIMCLAEKDMLTKNQAMGIVRMLQNVVEYPELFGEDEVAKKWSV